MILCLDVGNTHIFGGIFEGDKLLLRFRHATYGGLTSDQLGVFLTGVIRANNFDCKQITSIAFCSVVPSIDYSLRAACKKYFQLEPFVLQAGVKTEIKIKTQNPTETGADIIAGVIAAANLYPQKNLIILDLGTVTTIAAATKNKEFLGVTFIPGMYTAMNALQNCAAKLFPVEIIKPQKVIGRTTVESLQAGLFFGQLGAIKEIIAQITKELLPQEAPILIATGGFAYLFEQERIFDYIEPDLVLHGIRLAYDLNIPLVN
ncbi:MAG: pantothenate kinase [uncultured bacterium]|nr:MAG: pantothenate kinase [uncultured bacterium]